MSVYSHYRSICFLVCIMVHSLHDTVPASYHAMCYPTLCIGRLQGLDNTRRLLGDNLPHTWWAILGSWAEQKWHVGSD